MMDIPWRESSFYKEALDNIVIYNSNLLKERRSRLPYIDAQTGIAQKDCYLWRKKSERHKGNLPGQVYSYPSRRWRFEDSVSTQITMKVPEKVAEPSNGLSSGMVQTLEGGMVTKRSSRIAGLKKEDSAVSTSSNSRVPMGSPMSSELNEESDKDVDFMDEYDSEEERRLKRKRRSTRTRTINAPQKFSREQEKPFICNSCNRRYKTQASLKAHQTQYHAVEQVLPEVEKVKEEPPPTGIKKRNPYCDFCLGDDSINRKSGKVEKMVSCADCGRSGHPSCLQFSPALASVVLTYRWQCIECKSCSLCGKSDNDDQLLFCDDCDRGYHMYCLKPPMKEAPEGSWSCGMCKTIRTS